ncbi:NAD(P)-dependent oxidoreductase [Streptomyces sp. M19]
MPRTRPDLPAHRGDRGLIGARRLRRLGADGLLVNVSRGAVVDETALYEALRDRTIAGAALDVWHTPASPGTVPPSRLPFAELDNVVMTPHCSANADDTYRDRAEEVADNLLRLSVGAPLRNVVRAGGTP